ncbi:hypothetical protein FHR85_001075 [Alkalibacillus almallahensis]|nr:hypothetical protein [Alkalibacillus almallahensis]
MALVEQGDQEIDRLVYFTDKLLEYYVNIVLDVLIRSAG